MRKRVKLMTAPEEEKQEDTGLAVLPETVKPPPMFAVWLLNDDYTPMDFVVALLTEIFRKDVSEATVIMLRVHNEGRAICGVYALDMAETLATEAINLAKEAGHPLRCVVEKV